LPRGLAGGTVGAGLPAILSGRRARRGNRLQAGSYTAASFCHGAWAGHCRSRPCRRFFPGAVPAEVIACRQAPTPRLRSAVRPGLGTVGAGLPAIDGGYLTATRQTLLLVGRPEERSSTTLGTFVRQRGPQPEARRGRGFSR